MHLNARKIQRPGRSLGPLGMSKCLGLKASGWVCVIGVWVCVVCVQTKWCWRRRQACEDEWSQGIRFGDEVEYLPT
jgi:hypothetical protein